MKIKILNTPEEIHRVLRAETGFPLEELCECGHFRSEHICDINKDPKYGACTSECDCAQYQWITFIEILER